MFSYLDTVNEFEGLNQFSAIANRTLIQLLLEKKMKIKYVLTPSA